MSRRRATANIPDSGRVVEIESSDELVDFPTKETDFDSKIFANGNALPSFWEGQLLQVINSPGLLLLYLPFYVGYLLHVQHLTMPLFGDFSILRTVIFTVLAGDFLLQLCHLVETRYKFSFPRAPPLLLVAALAYTPRLVNQFGQKCIEFDMLEPDTRQVLTIFLVLLPFTVVGCQVIFLSTYEDNKTTVKKAVLTNVAAAVVYFMPIPDASNLSLGIAVVSFASAVYNDVYIADGKSLAQIAKKTLVAVTVFLALSHYYYRPPARSFLAEPAFPYSSPDSSIRILNSTQSISGMVVVGELIPQEKSAPPKKSRYPRGGPEKEYEQPMRYLRVDHAFVGGIWMPQYPAMDGALSFYSAFYLQELSQFVSPPPYADPANKSVILLGIGAGTSASGFEKSGYDVSVLDIDAAIYENAVKYFGLNPAYTAHIMDALAWVEGYQRGTRTQRYSVVNHDFFSGDNGDAKLYARNTFETIKNDVLEKDTGVLTVNVFGSPNSHRMLSIFHTLLEVFDGQCEMYHDKITDNMRGVRTIAVGVEEELNLVFLCRQKHAEAALAVDDAAIAAAVDQDVRGLVLATHAIRRLPRLTPAQAAELAAADRARDAAGRSRFRIFSRQSRGQWKIMDKVLPRIAWAYY